MCSGETTQKIYKPHTRQIKSTLFHKSDMEKSESVCTVHTSLFFSQTTSQYFFQEKVEKMWPSIYMIIYFF